jgi:hypothetical protein
MKSKRYTVESSDYRGFYIWDNFLVKIKFTGSQGECRDRAYELNNKFHSEFEIVETRSGSRIKRLQVT